MATDFWASSHYKRWIVDRAALKQARAEDLQYVNDPEYLAFLLFFFANAISKLGKKLGLRQRVIATAIVFFRRFYLKNSYSETDPYLVIAACCYVAAKAEESPVHIKNVITEAKLLFSQECYGAGSFSTENAKLAEMEFYLVDDLECDLTVFHPYRTLLTLCRKESAPGESHGGPDTEAGELGSGVDDGPRYWGTGEGQLELQEGALQMAWFVINDTYCSELCLLYPPHLIAIAAIYLSLVLHIPTRAAILNQEKPSLSQQTTPQPRRSSRQAIHAGLEAPKKPCLDPISFLSELNVSLPLIATIAQEIISMYALWERYKEDPVYDSAKPTFTPNPAASPFGNGASAATGSRRSGSASVSGPGSIKSQSNNGTPIEIVDDLEDNSGVNATSAVNFVTPSMLAGLVMRMREAKWADMAQSASGRSMPVNKMLERTQAAG